MDEDHWGVDAADNKVDNPLSSVLAFVNSSNVYLKQAAVVFAATTDALGDKADGPASNTFYFAGFMAALQKKDQSVETVAAVTYLLAQVFPKLPAPVLNTKADVIADMLMDVLRRHSDVAFLTKNTLAAISSLLKALEQPALAAKAGLKLVQAVLVFSVDPRPKIRRAAKKATVSVFRTLISRPTSSWGPNAKSAIPKPVWELVSRFVAHELSQCTKKDVQIALYICGLLQSMLFYLPVAPTAEILTNLLALTADGSPLLALQTFKVLSSVFSRGFYVSRTLASGETVEGFELSATELQERLSREASFVEQLIVSIGDLKPNANDAEGSAAFTAAIKAGFVCLHTLLPSRAHTRMAPLIMLLADNITSEKSSVSHSATACIRAMIRQGLDAELVGAGLVALSSGVTTGVAMHELLVQLRGLLSARFRLVWLTTLPVIETLFAVASRDSASLFAPILLDLDAMYNGSDSSSIHEAVERCIGAAFESLGPEAVLATLPLNLPIHHATASVGEQLEKSRPWLLPLIAENVKYANLSLFAQHLLPAGEILLQLAALAFGSKRTLEGKTMLTIAEQIWSTLPAFANVPLDTAAVFKPLAKKLAEYLGQPDTAFAVPYICKALRVLTSTNFAITQDRWGKGLDLTRPLLEEDEDEDEKSHRSKAAAATLKSIVKGQKNKKSDDSDSEDDSEDEAEDVIDESAELANLEKKSKPCPITKEQAQENVKVLAGFAKNFLPMLFNVASTTLSDHRSTVLDAILSYTMIADDKVKAFFFKNALEKYVNATAAAAAYDEEEEEEEEEEKIQGLSDDSDSEEEEQASNGKRRRTAEPTQKKRRMDPKKKAKKSKGMLQDYQALTETGRALSDILLAMAPGLPADCLELLFRAVAPHFTASDAGLQKKAYQIITLLADMNSQFFNAIWRDALVKLMEAGSTVIPGCMKARLHCCTRVYCNIPDILTHQEVVQTLPALLGEAIVSSKEVSRRTREAAYELVISIGRSVLDQAIEAGNIQYMTEFVYMILAGLAASTPHMKSATVTMLARILYEFRSSGLPGNLISEILGAVLVLLQSKTREIIKASLGFVKMALLSLSAAELGEHIESLISTVTSWQPEIKSRFKQRVRILFTILIKKFGVERVRELTPATDVRLVEHIKKMQERDEKSKKERLTQRKKDAVSSATNAVLMGDDDADTELLGTSRLGSGLSFEDVLNGDSDDEDNAADALSREINRTGVNAGSSTAFNKKRQTQTSDVWISDSADFLDSTVAKNISVGNGTNSMVGSTGTSTTNAKSSIPLNKQGKLDITALTSMLDEDEQRSLGIKPDADAINRKRKRAAVGDDIDDVNSAAAAARAARELAEKQRKDGMFDAKKKRDSNIGRSFASQKGAGDSMKRGAKHDPFAYMPLDPRSLNKRKSNLDSSTYAGAFAKSTTRHGQKAPRSQRQALKKKKSEK